MSNFLEITSNDNWFKKHPEKIAGVEYETTSFYFPIMVRGTKDDVLRVTGMGSELDKKVESKKAFYQQYVGDQSDQSKDKQKRIRIANANAKARIKILEMGLLGYSNNETITIEDYFENTKGSFKPLSTELVDKLMDAYLVYRRKKVKPNYLEVDGKLYKVDFESQKKSSFFKSRSNSFYFQPKGKKQIIRISDHWSKSKHSRSQKHNCGFIASCYWENLTADRVSYRLPGEKYSSELMGGLIDFKNLKRI